VHASQCMSFEHSPSIEAGSPDHMRVDIGGPSCCAAFALGDTRSTACSASYGKLVTAAACQTAAGAARITYGGSGTYSSYPYGCYWHAISGSVYFNANASGAANFYARPLCAGAAPTSTPVLECGSHFRTGVHLAGRMHPHSKNS
jgi:hypothetical protein